MAFKYSNNASSTLTAPITAAATSISISSADAGEFPSPAAGDKFALTLVDGTGALEVVWCTARTGGVLTVIRAQEGTTAKPFDTNTRADLRLTAGGLGNFVQVDNGGKIPAAQIPDLTATYQPLLSKVSIVELNGAQTVDAFSLIDFHSRVGGDYDARILRNLGVNGTFDIIQAGTGSMRFLGANAYTLDAPVTITGNIQVNATTIAMRVTGNKHLWLYNADGVEDALIYYDNANSRLNLRVKGNSGVYINTAGDLVAAARVYTGNGNSYVDSTGNLIGAIWGNFGGGHLDAFNSINTRIETRAAAHVANAVTSTRMAGYVEAQLTSSPAVVFTNNGYVLTMGKNIGGGAFVFGARQPQVYIANLGWLAAFTF